MLKRLFLSSPTVSKISKMRFNIHDQNIFGSLSSSPITIGIFTSDLTWEMAIFPQRLILHETFIESLENLVLGFPRWRIFPFPISLFSTFPPFSLGLMKVLFFEQYADERAEMERSPFLISYLNFSNITRLKKHVSFEFRVDIFLKISYLNWQSFFWKLASRTRSGGFIISFSLSSYGDRLAREK